MAAEYRELLTGRYVMRKAKRSDFDGSGAQKFTLSEVASGSVKLRR